MLGLAAGDPAELATCRFDQRLGGQQGLARQPGYRARCDGSCQAASLLSSGVLVTRVRDEWPYALIVNRSVFPSLAPSLADE